MKNKRGQVAIFIILGIALLVLILFLFRENIFSVIYTPKDPSSSVQECVKTSVEEALQILEPQGGEINPELFYMYKGNKLSYLCYTENTIETCVMQTPLVTKSVATEIENYIRPSVEECLESVKQNQIGKGYEVSMQTPNITVTLVPNAVQVIVDSDFTMKKEDITQSYKSIKTEVSSKLYELSMIAMSILNWEAYYGEAVSMNYMLYYPKIKVEQYKQGEGTIVYILSDRTTNEKFMFASRSLVVPVGITGE